MLAKLQAGNASILLGGVTVTAYDRAAREIWNQVHYGADYSGGGGGYYSVITLGEVRGVNTAGEPYVHAYTITMYNYNHYYGPKSTSNYNNNYYGKYRGGGGSASGSGGKAIRQPIHKKVVVQKGGGGIASTATTVGANTSNIISTAAGTSVFNARNLSVAQQAKYGVNALKGIAKGAGTIGVGLTLTTAGIEFAYGQANTHTIVDLCVCGAGLVCVGVAAVISAPFLALGTAVVGTVYGIGSAAGLGTTIDKASDNWGHKLFYGDEKDY